MLHHLRAIVTTRALRVPLLASLCAVLCLAVGAAAASAEITYQSSFGRGGTGAGEFARPAGVAVDNATGDVYVADYGNNRVEQFTQGGDFVRAWGYDVVASGEDDKPFVNEVDEVKIRATGGSFRLVFEEGEGFEKVEEATDFLPFDASPTEVEEALDGLEMINSEGGGVSVSGGPGDATGSTPYVVEFDEGPLKEKDVTLGLDASALALPPNTELTCAAGGAYGANGFSYQWLANGEPIAGATSSTFTPDSGQEGKAIQCQATVNYPGNSNMIGVSEPYFIGPGASTAPPPLAPGFFNQPYQIQTPESNPEKLPVGSSSGAVLTCNAGSWTRNPETYTYRWYRNGVEIASEESTATTSTYTLTDDDTEEKAHFQCSVTAANAGGASIGVSAFKNSEPAPEGGYVPTTTVTSPPSHSSHVITSRNGGGVFEVCQANPPSDDICKAGVAGPSLGQFNRPRSIAVDNSPGGNGELYVHDEYNFRVQKFSAEGQPILEFGQRVDEATEANICSAASGDPCGGGAKAIDETPGAIGFSGPVWFSDYMKQHVDLGNQLAVDPAGHVYLAEVRHTESDSEPHSVGCPEERCSPRIQKWDSNGNFISMARLPARNAAISVAVDSNETAYATVANGNLNGIERVSREEFGPTGGDVHQIGNFFLPTGEPRQTAIDPRNDRLLVSDLNEKEQIFSTEQTSVCGGPRIPGQAVIEFDAHMNQIDCTVPLAAANLPEVTGMSVTEQGVFYGAVGNSNVIKIFHLPVPAAPVIDEEAAKKITTQSGDLHAQINPGFEETTYRVEYGLGDCEVTTCATAYGEESLGGLKFADAVVKIKNLEPEKTYHYRFIAENALGEVKGEDKTFTTYPLVDITNDECPNALARKQTRAAGLLDCRAFELVSAGWTGGYDVVSNLVPGQNPFDGYPGASDKVLYGVKDGGIPGTGFPTNRGIDPYLAERDPASGWHTRYVGIPSNNPYAQSPFSSTLLGATPDLSTFAFGGPGICDPCFADGSSGVPVRLPSGELTQGMAGSESHPEAEEAGYVAKPLSADGKHLVFGSSSVFAQPATQGNATLYEREIGGGGPATEVITTGTDGSPLSGEVGELDISSDGSRTVVGEEVGTDAAGNPLWHPYLHVRGSADSIDLAEGTTSGVHFNGMNSNGSVIYFSTVDSLPVDQPFDDEDESIDIYRAEVDGSGDVSLDLVSVNSDGSVSNYDGCETPGKPRRWNAIEGDGNCNAVAFAGGSGEAAGDGTFYFVSPEQLDGGKGIENQANLYVVRPGEAPKPKFVALMDSSLEKSGQPPAQHPLITEKFGGAEIILPDELTFDSARNDLYAIEYGTGSVIRYHADGTPDNFTAGPGAGTNARSGFSFEIGSYTQPAVDNSPGSEGTPLESALYVPDYGGVHVIAPSGEQLGVINGSGTANGVFGQACGVAVDQSSGAVYISDHAGYIWQYTPNSPAGTIDDSDYTVKGIKTESVQPCPIAVDTLGNLYAAQSKGFTQGVGFVYRWSTSSFNSAPETVAGAEVGAGAAALATNPETNELYVDTGKLIRVFEPSGTEIANYGNGKLVCSPEFTYQSRGIAVNPNNGHTYASCLDSFSTFKGTIREWGFEQPPYAPIDNPAIVHGVLQPEVHTWGDFQITSDSRYAAFASVVPLKPGYDNGGRYEVYRYQDGNGELVCASCDPTGSQASTDSVLPPSGLGLLQDGRLFFNTGESLTLADANGKLDAYEWSPKRDVVGGCKADGGCQQLISTGTSAHAEGLLGVSSSGRDAFFFTRDVLVPEDKNGQAMKIYDAREEGGFFVIPPPPPCAASDECHGPGTQAQAPPQIGTFRGTGGQAPQHRSHRCKKGQKRKHGHCVRKHRHRRRHRRHHRHHNHEGARRHSHDARQGGSR
jgi:hypothetical protein